MAAIFPLAYGYIRDEFLDSPGRRRCDRRLRDIARRLGYDLGAVFHEPPVLVVPAAFIDLVHACRRAEAHTVLTLPGHMSGTPVPPMVLMSMLAERGDARIYEIPESKWTGVAAD